MRALVLVMSASCQRVPLSLAPIVDATEEERALLEQEIAAFESAVGEARVEIHSITMVDYISAGGNELAGYYQSTTGRIVLSRGYSDPSKVLRHELCHALDDAEDLTSKPEPLLDDLSSYIFTKTEMSEIWESSYQSIDTQREEAFARLCEYGAVAVDALSKPCPGESALISRASQWMMDHVYSEHVRLEPLDLSEIPWVTLDAWDEGFGSFVSASRAPSVVLARERGSGGWVRAADLYTGRLVASSPTAAFDSTTHPYLPGVFVGEAAGYPDGPAVVSGLVSPGEVRIDFLRLFTYDREHESWRTTSECGARGDLFTADGEVFRSLTDGELLRWQKLSP